MTILKQSGRVRNAERPRPLGSSRRTADFGGSREISPNVRRTLRESCASPPKKAQTGPRLVIGLRWNFGTRGKPRRFKKVFHDGISLSAKVWGRRMRGRWLD